MNRSGFEIVCQDGKYGLQDDKGTLVVPCIYDKILDYDDDGYIRVLKGEIYGTVDLKGNPAIPHSMGITHLGVFHKGSARARKDGLWGLVDVHGNCLTGYVYKDMGAHRSFGYRVITQDNEYGIINEKGDFKKSAGTKHSPFQSIRVFHNGVAPAYTYQMKWIFIDKDHKRVNDYEYWSMDSVLRNGIYTVAYAPNQYSAAKFDGTPITTDTFDYPLHFEYGLSRCCKKHLDSEGKEVTIEGGQPMYDYGIIKDNGEYLFPMEYHFLDWNNPKTKDCWYAEDECASYILFPNGKKLIFYKCPSHKYQPYIPKELFSHHITQEQFEAIKNTPKVIYDQPIKQFNRGLFFSELRNWIDAWHDFDFYYRDTDAPVDVEKTYRVGKIIRCGSDMELTRKLLRPVHKIRFIIASHHIASAEDLKKDEDAGEEYVSFEEYVAGRNTYFMVLDNYHYGSTTQILLLQLPYTALQIAKVFGVRLTPSVLKKESLAGMDVIGTSRTDLQIKMSEPVHGHSLSTVWTAKMHQPIGFDQDARKVSIRPEHIDAKVQNEEYTNSLINYDGFLKRDEFLKDNYSNIKIAIGNVKHLKSDAIVTKSDGESESPIKSGTCSLVSEIGEPYDHQLLVSYPKWQEGKADEMKLLQSCYRSALKISQENKFDSIGFSCLGLDKGYPIDTAVSIAAQTTMEYMTTGKFDGNVVFCVESEAIVARYIKEINKLI